MTHASDLDPTNHRHGTDTGPEALPTSALLEAGDITVQTVDTSSPKDSLVVPLRAPRWAAWSFPVMSAVLAVGSIVWMVLAPSWEAFLYGTLMIGSLAWVWGTRLAARRTRGTASMQIVATKEGLRSPLWELDWGRVDRMWIGRTESGRLKALNIEPLQPADIRRPPSRALRLNAVAGSAMKIPAIQILQANVDLPLEELAARFEEKAGRPLLVQPEGDQGRG